MAFPWILQCFDHSWSMVLTPKTVFLGSPLNALCFSTLAESELQYWVLQYSEVSEISNSQPSAAISDQALWMITLGIGSLAERLSGSLKGTTLQISGIPFYSFLCSIPLSFHHLCSSELWSVSSTKLLLFYPMQLPLCACTYPSWSLETLSLEESWDEYGVCLLCYPCLSGEQLSTCPRPEITCFISLFAFIVTYSGKLRLITATESWLELENPWCIFICSFLAR